jgi:hypothetical protein
MDAALYFELVDAVARIDGQAELAVVSERVMATPLHPFERLALDRVLRARSEALVLQRELLPPGLLSAATPEAKPLEAHG